jgi:hypothetical protein
MKVKPTTFADITPERVAEHNEMADAINRLVADLEDAAAEFYQPGEHQRRQGSAGAIEAVVKFLHAMNIDVKLRQPLVRLWGALRDAEHGIPSPATTPRKHTGGPRTPVGDDLLRVQAAVAVTLLRDAQESLPSALTKACKAAGNNLTVDNLKDYRKQLGSGKKVSELAKKEYHRQVSGLRCAIKSGRLTARDAANIVLTHLRQTKVD